MQVETNSNAAADDDADDNDDDDDDDDNDDDDDFMGCLFFTCQYNDGSKFLQFSIIMGPFLSFQYNY